MISIELMPSPTSRRQQHLQNLANSLKQIEPRSQLIEAYIQDTGFLYSHVIKRELLVPAALLELAGKQHDFICKLGLDIDYQQRQPLGKVAVLLPKNSLGLTMSKAVAASYLMGNETLIKLPNSLVNTQPLYRELFAQHGDQITFADPKLSAKQFLLNCITDPEIQAIVIYGDDRWIHDYWPLAKEYRKCFIFEGPGNDPLVVLDSANVEAAVDAAVRCGLNNGGQSCSASERFFVHTSCIDRFTELLAAKLADLLLGSPEDPATQVGPIFSDKVLDRLVMQITEAQHQGAQLVTGGQVIADVYQGKPILRPAVLTHCSPEMSVVRDENFGPVFPIIEFDRIDHLISMLDNNLYGLNASVFGDCPPELAMYLENSHRNMYYNSTAVDPENIPSRILDGGCKLSGFVWRQTSEGYVEQSGYRYLPRELSQPK